ncbi:transcription factor 7-like 1 [Corythoichthys intestinalis]|uniref:transcription factor 7-like 1 n=1 Tax=Corythoichthys intestinalis TaxID=161448 RepID=UPI0025A62A36|nr:transcription factor 7-like 1 [Corythoichthys intestinalis]
MEMSSFTKKCLPQNATQTSQPDGTKYNNNNPKAEDSQHRGYNGFVPIQNSYMQPSPVMAAPSMHFVPMNLQPLSQSIETLPNINGQTNFVPEVMLPNGMNMRPVGLLNGELLYKVTAPPNIAAPLPANAPKIKKKTKKIDDQVEDQTYVKKPLNAFMLFSKEHRQDVKAKSSSTNIAVINETLGKMWHLLPDKEKAKYFEKADEERRRHSQQHPDWSCRHNYGKKKYDKRRRTKATAALSSQIL